MLSSKIFSPKFNSTNLFDQNNFCENFFRKNFSRQIFFESNYINAMLNIFEFEKVLSEADELFG